MYIDNLEHLFYSWSNPFLSVILEINVYAIKSKYSS